MRLGRSLLVVWSTMAVACGSGSSGSGPGDVGTDRGVLTDLAGDGPAQPWDVLADAAVPDGNAPEVAGDALPDAQTCQTGEQKCTDDATAVICQNDVWVTTQVCSGQMICLAGACTPKEECQPGSIAGCHSLAARKLCHVSGKGYVPLPCPEGEKCMDGECSLLVCNPGVKECQGPAMYRECLPDGSGWTEPAACPEGDTCLGGQCLSGCAGDIKYNMSNVGCEFWSVDLGQWDVKPGESNLEPSAAVIPHAVVIANPNDLPVKVTFEVGDGTPVVVPDPVVPPGESRAFEMPVLSVQESGISKKSIRVRTNHPVTAAQFNPSNNEDFVHTSDASLLYPVNILGTEHYVVSLPSKIGPEMPMIGKMPSVWGFATVVAVEPGTTQVSLVNLTAPTEPGPGFQGYPQGTTFSVELEQWEVLNVNSLASSMMGPDYDMTGTQIVSDKKTAVFSGHQCYVLGESNCDHMEAQLLPVEAWGDTYVAGRMDTPAPNEYRVVSGADGNVISTTPPVGALAGVTLNKGEWKHAASDDSFEITGTGQLQVIQFIAGNSSYGAVLVDPSMTPLIPTHQFRNDYPILVPTAYDANFVNVARDGDSEILLNGQPVGAFFTPVPGTAWEVANVPVDEGMNVITGAKPFGLISYGYATKVSYAYPAGLNGQPAQ